MASKIERALRQALTTFSSVQENFNDNFAILRQLVGELDAESVGLDPMLLRYDQYEILEMYEMHDNDPLLESRNRRPVPITFIKIFENDQLSASVFVLRDGAKIPLHNHPYMHGLLKVIHGKVKIQSFTIACSQSYHRSKIHTSKLAPVIATENDGPCALYPLEGNIHQIDAVEGPAAFVDIISPPYVNDGIGRCRFYKEIKTSKGIQLESIGVPRDYRSDLAKYYGPTFNLSTE